MKSDKYVQGVTLIELLITTSLIGMMGLAVFSSFASGINVWQRSQKTNDAEVNIRIALDELAKDLRSTFKFQGISFEGREYEMSLPAYVYYQDEDGETQLNIGKRRYFFDEGKKTIFVQEFQYHSLFKMFEKPKSEVVIDGIERVLLNYYDFDEEVQQYEWKPVWEDKSRLPQGVKIQIFYMYEEEETELLRTVYLPVDYRALEQTPEEDPDDAAS